MHSGDDIKRKSEEIYQVSKFQQWPLQFCFMGPNDSSHLKVQTYDTLPHGQNFNTPYPTSVLTCNLYFY